MAYSSDSTALAAVASYIAADKPFLGTQFKLTPSACTWHNSGSTTDRTNSTYPSRRAYDGLPGLVTKPTTASADKVWYLSFVMPYPYVDIDFVGIIGHNFGSLHTDGALTITLEIDDASNFATAISIPITVTTSTSNARIMALSLKHTGSDALRYSSVRYCRLKIARGATNFTPEIGDLVLGRRVQMYHKPDVPYDVYARHSSAETTITHGGVIYRTTYYKGARILSAAWEEDNTTLHSDIESFISASDYKTRPFVWIENPNSAPASWHLMVADDVNHFMPLDENPSKRVFELQATEQGPESHYLSKGTY